MAGLCTKVGLNTFTDPRDKGGKLTSKTTENLSTLMLNPKTGEEMLFYPSFPIHVSIIRATTAVCAVCLYCVLCCTTAVLLLYHCCMRCVLCCTVVLLLRIARCML